MRVRCGAICLIALFVALYAFAFRGELKLRQLGYVKVEIRSQRQRFEMLENQFGPTFAEDEESPPGIGLQ